MNEIFLAGIITGEILFSHETYGEKFYRFYVASSRTSGVYDVLPCVASEVLIKNIEAGEHIKVLGEIRTRNVWECENNHLEIVVFVKEVLPYIKDENYVTMDGFLCKEPVYRETPSGRKICDFLLAVNRKYHKSDYIPCISWGRGAIKTSYFAVGNNIELTGRLQSRKYIKYYENEEKEIKTVYEVSLNNINKIEEVINSENNN